MTIAVLAWGSLIWEEDRGLKILDKNWKEDGRALPLEFARISGLSNLNKPCRITLVIKPNFPYLNTLWNLSNHDNMEDAMNNLAIVEGTTSENNIGFFNFSNSTYRINREEKLIAQELNSWRQSKNIDAVIWTDLGPNFSNVSKMHFTSENILEYCSKQFSDMDLKASQEYICRTHQQIKTRFRKDLERGFERIIKIHQK